MQNSEIFDKLIRIPTPIIAALDPSQETAADQLNAFYRISGIPFVRHAPLPVAAHSGIGAVGRSLSQTQSQRIVLGANANVSQIPTSAVSAGTQNNVTLSSAALAGSLPSLKINRNVMNNFTNNATVDSIDNGTNATIRVYGPGGVGTTWHQQVSGLASQEFAAVSITAAYTTKFFVFFNPLTGVLTASTSGFAGLPDGLIYCGTVTTVASGGGGGIGGGGGTGGGGGGRYYQ